MEPVVAGAKCVLFAAVLGGLALGGRRAYDLATDAPDREEQLACGVRTGRAQDVRAALAKGAPVNVPDMNDFTPLMWAATLGNMESIQLLLDRGANVRHMSASGMTSLMTAAQSGQADVVERLLEAGADPNQQVTGGPTALFVAANSGHEGVVEVLLAHGARADARSWHGRTPLMAAAGHTMTTPRGLHRLLDAGADVNASDYTGATARGEAVDAGRDDLAALLDSPRPRRGPRPHFSAADRPKHVGSNGASSPSGGDPC